MCTEMLFSNWVLQKIITLDNFVVFFILIPHSDWDWVVCVSCKSFKMAIHFESYPRRRSFCFPCAIGNGHFFVKYCCLLWDNSSDRFNFRDNKKKLTEFLCKLYCLFYTFLYFLFFMFCDANSRRTSILHFSSMNFICFFSFHLISGIGWGHESCFYISFHTIIHYIHVQIIPFLRKLIFSSLHVEVFLAHG